MDDPRIINVHPGLKAFESLIISSQATYAALNAVEVAVFHFRGSIKRLCRFVSSFSFKEKKNKDEWSLVYGMLLSTLPPLELEKEHQWDPEREFR